MDIISSVGAGFSADGHSSANSRVKEQIWLKNRYTIECYDRFGMLKWIEYAENLVTDVGVNDVLDKYLKGSGYTAAFYVGLISGQSPTIAAGDTMSSHAGWSEFTNYVASSPNVRPTLTLGSVASQSVDNSANKAAYTISVASPNSQEIGGCFLVTDNTIGGTAGILYSAAAFSGGYKTLTGSDLLNVTATCTASSA